MASVRILFTRFPLESTFGGAEVQTLSLMEGLIARSHAVAFLGSCPVMLTECANRKIPHAKLDIGAPPVTKFGAVSFAWRKRGIKAKLRSALRTFHDLDAVVMMSLSEKLLMTEELAKKGIKVFWLEHDRVGRWLSQNPWLSGLRRQSNFATTICVSELSKKIYLDLGWDSQKIVAIPNGIDIQRFSSEKRVTGSELRETKSTKPETRNSKLYVGCVARLSQEKGVDVLIQAASAVPEIDLEITGSGPDEGYLRKMIEMIQGREHSDQPRMKISPRIENLCDFYSSIDVLVLPSRDNDPFGLVAAEAMALGIPVIVTSACGIADYVQDGQDALIVEASSEQALAGALKKMLDPDFRNRIARAGKETARAKFGVERMIDEYETLLSKN